MAVATVIGGDGRGRRWKNDGIVIAAEPFDLFFLLVGYSGELGVFNDHVGGLGVGIWWWG